MLTKRSSTLKIYAFIDDSVLVKEISVTGDINSLKMIKKYYDNNFAYTSIAIFLTLNNNGERLVQLCLL